MSARFARSGGARMGLARRVGTRGYWGVVVGEGGRVHDRTWASEIGIYTDGVLIASSMRRHKHTILCEFLKTERNQNSPTPTLTTYRLFGSWFFRDFAVLTGSNDFTISSDTGVSSELPDSSSLNWLDDGVFAAASSLALRRPHAVCGRTHGARARGNERARYRDGSETAILRCSRRCRCRRLAVHPEIVRRR